jgi:hypothetical protein
MGRSLLVGAVVVDGWISDVMDWLLSAIVCFVVSNGAAGEGSEALRIWMPTIECVFGRG